MRMNPAEHGVLKAICGRGRAQALPAEEVALLAKLEPETAADILARFEQEGLAESRAEEGPVSGERRFYWNFWDYETAWRDYGRRANA